jgi:hypothetical protein
MVDASSVKSLPDETDNPTDCDDCPTYVYMNLIHTVISSYIDVNYFFVVITAW